MSCCFFTVTLTESLIFLFVQIKALMLLHAQMAGALKDKRLSNTVFQHITHLYMATNISLPPVVPPTNVLRCRTHCPAESFLTVFAEDN